MLIISVICQVGSIILFIQIAPGSIGRTAMILLGIYLSQQVCHSTCNTGKKNSED